MSAEKKLQKSIVYPKVGLKDVLGAIWNGIKPQKWLFYILIVSMILANIVTIITPLFYKQFFDIIASPGVKSVVAQKLFMLILYVLAFNVLNWIF